MASLGETVEARTARIADLVRCLPPEDVTLTLGARQRVYRGASLSAYGVAAGLVDAGAAPARGYFVVTAADGARASVALAEALPTTSARPILLATEQDGEPLRVGVRLVVPQEGTRSLLGVTGVEFHQPTPGSARPGDGTVDVTGRFPRPGRYQVATRPVERTVDVEEDGIRTSWAGIRLSDLLAEAGMFFMTDGEDLAGQVVIVTAEDGRHAVLAASEVGPEYVHAPALLATHRAGVPLDVPALVVPYDRVPVRRLDAVVAVSLCEGGANRRAE